MTRITRFEKTRLISARALQLAFGAPPLVKPAAGMTAYELSVFELEQGILPLVIMRHFPDGRIEKVTV